MRDRPTAPANPLELATAATFAVLFVVISIASSWATLRFGSAGIYALAAIVGVSDIDPFVLNLAQGDPAQITVRVGAGAILVADIVEQPGEGGVCGRVFRSARPCCARGVGGPGGVRHRGGDDVGWRRIVRPTVISTNGQRYPAQTATILHQQHHVAAPRGPHVA